MPGNTSTSTLFFFIDKDDTMATKQIFVNLPVKNLDKTKAFFAALGYTFNEQFTDANAACMVVQKDSIHVMLLVEEFFKTFTTKSITDTAKSTEVLLCLSCESRAEVDELVAKAKAAGGTTPTEPKDYGFMYGHGFQDIDGHLWELVYMDPNAEMPKQ
jgi:predicted lactoylglutathione lyase